MRLFSAATKCGSVLISVALLAGCGGTSQLAPQGGANASLHRAAAGTDSILYALTNGANDGLTPYDSPIVNSKGVLFGTTMTGSSTSHGLVWELTKSGSKYKESPLFKFPSTASAGAYPESGLIADSSGVLYGTAATGGKGKCSYIGKGCGVIYKLTPSGKTYKESMVYDFGAGKKGDGSIPGAALLLVGKELYGTTEFGGTGKCLQTGYDGCGTVFKVSTSGSGYSVLYSFQGGSDGQYPSSSVVADKNGVLYGTTNSGGGSSACPNGCGTVYSLTPNSGKYAESVLHAFTGSPDGTGPGNRGRGLYVESNGTIVGTTHTGGTGGCAIVFVPGCGIVFTLTPNGSKYTEAIAYTFTGGNDAAFPEESLIAGSDGSLYGASTGGGGSSSCNGGCGAVFKLTPSSSGFTESVIYGFKGGSDSALPYDGVTIDKSGTLYGTTAYGGGSKNCNNGCGTVFSVKP